MRTFTTEMLADELRGLHDEMVRVERSFWKCIARLHPAWRSSGRNLLDYLALRRRDVRPLQEALAQRGLSSLGRAEGRVRKTVEAVLALLTPSGARAPDIGAAAAVNHDERRTLLEIHSDALLGPARPSRAARIMVTLPSEAADDRGLVRSLIENGMDIARINCAHDDQSVWARMVENVHREARLKRARCQIMMDLPGPKLRTGAITAPAVVKIHPARDDFGHVTEPGRVCLVPTGEAEPGAGQAHATLVLPDAWLARCGLGDEISFSDARGAARRMTVCAIEGAVRYATLLKTAYLAAGTALTWRGSAGERAVAPILELGSRPGFILLHHGDRVVLTRDPAAGVPARMDDVGRVVSPARVPCTLPEAFQDVRAGESIWFDDGRIRGIVRDVSSDEVVVEILSTRPEGEKLRADKGINLPDSNLRQPALTEFDLRILPFVAKHADSVGLSFVHEPADVTLLQDRLAALDGEDLGLVLKIETRRAFESLPDLLLAAMRSPRVGVMIARGDLAVECGYERLAEVQEEILWIAEAAHVPVIWATQVLEGLAKDGIPSRAEVTDAAMGQRAECVMLNKGPHISEAVRFLDGILGRMQGHQHKKTPMLRKLHLAQNALDASAGGTGITSSPSAAPSRR